MIPERKGTTYPQFLKQVELKKGVIATITTEFQSPENPKITSFLIGNVIFNGSTYTLGINPSTYRNLCITFGDDTANWINKDIKFLGMVKLGKGNGYLWAAVE